MTTAESARKEATEFLNDAVDHGRKAAKQFQKTAGKKFDKTWNQTSDAVRDAASSARGYVKKQGSGNWLGKLACAMQRHPAVSAAVVTGIAIFALTALGRDNESE